MMDQHILGGGE